MDQEGVTIIQNSEETHLTFIFTQVVAFFGSGQPCRSGPPGASGPGRPAGQMYVTRRQDKWAGCENAPTTYQHILNIYKKGRKITSIIALGQLKIYAYPMVIKVPSHTHQNNLHNRHQKYTKNVERYIYIYPNVSKVYSRYQAPGRPGIARPKAWPGRLPLGIYGYIWCI